MGERLADPIAAEAFARWCEHYSDYVSARAELEKTGRVAYGGKNGAPYPHPLVGVMLKANDAMNRLEARLDIQTKGDAGPSFDVGD